MRHARLPQLSTVVPILALLSCFTVLHAQQASGTALPVSYANYSRVIRLTLGDPGRLIASSSYNDGSESIFYSDDDGNSFNYLSSITDPDQIYDHCCGTIFQLPNDAGGFGGGTLLYAGTYGYTGGTPSIKVYASDDFGNSWHYDSTVATGSSATSGVWEPQFAIASDGALVIYWSDETDPAHSQKLREARRYNGNGWQDYSDVVAGNDYNYRPGMAVVHRSSDGVYLMTYELGYANAPTGSFADTFRTSSDGWNWGSSTDLGTKIQTSDGQYFKGSPYSIWADNPGGGGDWLVVGQLFLNSDNSTAAGNGTTMLYNPNSDGSGPWYVTAPPVNVPDAANNPCQNYSSPLLQSSDLYSIIGIANDYDGNGICQGYYARHGLY